MQKICLWGGTSRGEKKLGQYLDWLKSYDSLKLLKNAKIANGPPRYCKNSSFFPHFDIKYMLNTQVALINVVFFPI